MRTIKLLITTLLLVLSANAVALHAAGRHIRRHADTTPTTEPSVSTSQFSSQDSFYQEIYLEPVASDHKYDNKLTGGWGGYRKKMEDAGVSMGLSYTNNLLGNPSGGLSQGFAYDDSSGLNMVFDLQKLLALHGWSFYLSILQRNGTSLSATNIGNLFPVSQIFGGQTFRMDVMYLTKSMLDGKLQFSFGRLNAGDYFLQSPLYYSYVSNAYDGNPIGVFFNVIFSAYPNPQWAAYVYTRPTAILAGKLAVFNTNKEISANQYHGFNFSFRGDNGVMLITEWDLLNNKSLCLFSCNLPGRYTVGFMYLTGSDQSNFVTGNPVTGNYGFYYQAEQKLYQPGMNALRGLSTFLTMQFFPGEYNKIPLFYDLGLIYRGLVASRPLDFLALGFAYGKFSDTLAAAARANGTEVQGYEANVELSYRIYVTKWFFFQPDIQYVVQPNGFTSIPNAWVFGAQMSVDF